jgi:hypothetical protein
MIREVNLVKNGNGKGPSVAAILLGRRQTEEIAKTRSPPRPISLSPCRHTRTVTEYRDAVH